MYYAMISSLFFLFAEKAQVYYYNGHSSDSTATYCGRRKLLKGYSQSRSPNLSNLRSFFMSFWVRQSSLTLIRFLSFYLSRNNSHF